MVTQVTQGARDSIYVSPIKALIPLGLKLPGHVIICEPQEGWAHQPESLSRSSVSILA